VRAAFEDYINTEELEVVYFRDIPATALGDVIAAHSFVLKPLLAVCCVAGRAIERDLGIRNLDTYRPKLTPKQAQAIAGYIKPYLPDTAPVAALCMVDQVEFIDKEVRKRKGNWETRVRDALVAASGCDCVKRQFSVAGESFELDAAWPSAGDIEVGVDIKRIEARRDIHKRSDEIVNKAARLKEAHPQARFAAVIYYPFVVEHGNVRERLRSDRIDCVVFAAETDASIADAARFLVATLGLRDPDRLSPSE
jgi:hypothetical protein